MLDFVQDLAFSRRLLLFVIYEWNYLTFLDLIYICIEIETGAIIKRQVVI
jgi:hypothetical protein